MDLVSIKILSSNKHFSIHLKIHLFRTCLQYRSYNETSQMLLRTVSSKILESFQIKSSNFKNLAFRLEIALQSLIQEEKYVPTIIKHGNQIVIYIGIDVFVKKVYQKTVSMSISTCI